MNQDTYTQINIRFPKWLSDKIKRRAKELGHGATRQGVIIEDLEKIYK